MIRSLGLTVLLALSLCACARGAQTPPTATPAAQPSKAASAAQAPVTPSTQSAQTETQMATAAQETAGEDSDEDRGQARSDASLEHLAALPAEQQLPAGKWKPGTHYDPIVPAQPTSAEPGKVEVVEVFWLGCPHCYALEPFIQSWMKNKPEYIQFVRVPVMWGPVHRAHARLFYTLQALNRADLVQKAFDTIARDHNMLVANSEDETLRLQTAFAKDNGISPDDFTKAYNSFSVNSNLQRAEQLTQRYHVEGVPLIVVDGKYSTDVGKAGGHSELIELIDYLAAAEHRH
ncbi:MAG TPA: DsbA family protein [Steroidobacteraceae bacterium]|nr:DsbA family protein [Steroidobacteraceae bacterium]